jgi:hypothetical protein
LKLEIVNVEVRNQFHSSLKNEKNEGVSDKAMNNVAPIKEFKTPAEK